MNRFPSFVKYSILSAVLIFNFSYLSFAQAFSGKVVGVFDGDTISVMHSGKYEKIRLDGIDCPEMGQPFGAKAKQFTSEMVFGKTVTIAAHGKDQYGRTLGDVILSDGGNLNQELVRAGFAWWYRHYSNDKTLKALEKAARQARIGLWADPHPIAPWVWRYKNR